MNEKERRERLNAVAGVIELVLGPEWLYVITIGKPGEAGSFNMMSNCPPGAFEEVMNEILRRWKDGNRPKELYENPPEKEKETPSGFDLPDSLRPG
jgi:hypothetical protein